MDELYKFLKPPDFPWSQISLPQALFVSERKDNFINSSGVGGGWWGGGCCGFAWGVSGGFGVGAGCLGGVVVGVGGFH